MTKPKLSICIRTYNRGTYLKRALSSLVSLNAFPFDYEIIVSDNCSTDETPIVAAGFVKKCERVRYVKQTRNVGAERNLISAFRMAMGEFVVNLADDDMLIPEAVASVVRYMDQNPSIVACHAPWEMGYDATQQSLELSYSIEKEMVFEKKNSVDLFNFIIQRHIFPEVAVYRTSALHKILYPSHKAYWAFVNLARLLDYGDIAFMPYSFYRFTVHWKGDAGDQHGYQQTIGEWDLYRGGVEYLLHKAFRNAGYPGVPAKHRDVAQRMINQFMAARLFMAFHHMLNRKDFIGANEVFARLLLCGTLPEAEVSRYSRLLPPRAAAQSLIETFAAMTGLKRIDLYRVSDLTGTIKLLKELREDLPVKALTDDAIRKSEDKEKALVLAGGEAERQKLLKAGFPDGLVIVEGELVSQFKA
jgi:glycosyltransferase involved in cell wall biosynthesis